LIFELFRYTDFPIRFKSRKSHMRKVMYPLQAHLTQKLIETPCRVFTMRS